MRDLSELRAEIDAIDTEMVRHYYHLHINFPDIL